MSNRKMSNRKIVVSALANVLAAIAEGDGWVMDTYKATLYHGSEKAVKNFDPHRNDLNL